MSINSNFNRNMPYVEEYYEQHCTSYGALTIIIAEVLRSAYGLRCIYYTHLCNIA